MAMGSKSAGSLVELDDLQAWYTQFNTFADKYGTSDMKVSMSSTAQPVATDYNTLINLVSKYRADDYLKLVTWPTVNTVKTQDLLAISTARTGLNNIANVQATIKCRNSIAYSNVKKSNGTGNSDSRKCSESYYNEGHISLSNTYYNCCQSRSYYNSNSQYTHSNDYHSNGGDIDVLNSKTE